MLHQAYSRPSLLLFGNDDTIPSACGLQQGDPFGPPVFALAINDVVQTVTSPLNVWYLDDVTIGGGADTVISDIQTILPLLAAAGLEVNPAKSEIIFTSNNIQNVSVKSTIENILPGIQEIDHVNFEILGSPIHSDAIPRYLESKCDALKRLIERLKLFDAHIAFTLLRNAFSISKLLYLLRSAPTYMHPDGLKKFDDTQHESFTNLCNVILDDEQRDIASFPLRFGGIGLRKAQDLASAAYISSIHASAPTITVLLSKTTGRTDITEECVQLRDEYCREWGHPSDNDDLSSQKMWDELALKKKFESKLENADQFVRARLKAAASPRSGSWLNALPVLAIGNRLDDESFRVGIGLRTGARLCEPHTCRCGANIDAFARHPISCRNNSFLIENKL